MSAEIRLVIDSYTQSDSLDESISKLTVVRDLMEDISKLNSKTKSFSNPKDMIGNLSESKTKLAEIEKQKAAIENLNGTSIEALRLRAQEENQIKRNTKSAKESADVFKKAEKDKQDSLKKTGVSNSAVLKDNLRYAQVQAAMGKDLKTQIVLQDKHAGIIEKMRAKLSQVTKQWVETTDASQLDEKATGTLANQKLILTEKLKVLEKATGDNRREVGNYGLSLSNLSKGLGGTAKLVASVGAAFGFETEGLRELAHIGKEFIKTSIELREIHRGELEIEKEATVAHSASAVATEEQTVAQETNTTVTEQATVAQTELNTAIELNPYLIATIGLAALVVGIGAYLSSSKATTLAEEERAKASDGTIIKNKELRESYNKLVISIYENGNALKVARGQMTGFEADIDNAKFENLQKLHTSLNEVKATFVEENGVVNDLRKSITGVDVALEMAAKKAKQLSLQNQADNIAAQLAATAKRELESIKNVQDVEVAVLESRKAQQELMGQNTIVIQRKILLQQEMVDEIRAASEADADGKIRLLREKLNADLLGIDKAYEEQRRSALDELNNLHISLMDDDIAVQKDGYKKQLELLNENFRQQSETVKYNTNLIESERAKELDLLEQKRYKDEVDLLAKHEADLLKTQMDGEQKRIADYQAYWDDVIKVNKENFDYQVALNDAMNNLEESALRDKLQKKIITQEQYDADIAKNKLALDEENKKQTLKNDADNLDTLNKKLEIAKQSEINGVEGAAKEVNDINEQITAAKHKQDIDELNWDGKIADDKIAIAKLEAEKEKLIRDGLLEDSKKFVSQIIDIETNRSDNKIAELDRQANAEDEKITQQELRADQGLKNTLAFEEDKKVKLEKAALEEEKRQVKIKKIEAYWNLVAAFAKSGDDKAAKDAAEQIFVGEGLTLAFAEKGGMGEDLKETTMPLNGDYTKSHSAGDIPTLISPKEGVLTEQNIAALGGRDGFYDLKRMLENPVSDDLFARQRDSFSNAAIIAPQIDLRGIIEGIGEKFEQSIKKIQQDHYNIDSIGNLIHTRTKENSRVITNKGVFVKPKRNKLI